jgi:ribosomal protein L11 methyltransferase
MSSTYKVTLLIPKKFEHSSSLGAQMTRELFFEWLWERFNTTGLVGIHEGTVLIDSSTQAAGTELWMVDSAEAPQERDWIEDQEQEQSELFFSSREGASEAVLELRQISDLSVGEVEEQEAQDWDAKWRASFLSSPEGVCIPPFWRVVPPWILPESAPSEHVLQINPGAGFGTGTHETTQLCLEAMGNYFLSTLSKKGDYHLPSALDFGTGSGILAIALASLGFASVDAVEIDPLAIENAKENAKLNHQEDHICFSAEIATQASEKKFGLIVANILKSVLLECSEALTSRLQSKGGVLILSGLLEKDLEPVLWSYSRLLDSPSVQLLEKGEWRCLLFQLMH